MFNNNIIPPSQIFFHYLEHGSFDNDPYAFLKLYLETVHDDKEILTVLPRALQAIIDASKLHRINLFDKETNKFLKHYLLSTVTYDPTILFESFGLVLDLMFDKVEDVPESTYELILKNSNILANCKYLHSVKYLLYKSNRLTSKEYSSLIHNYVINNISDVKKRFLQSEENVFYEDGVVFRHDCIEELKNLFDIKYSCSIFKHIPEDYAIEILDKHWTEHTYKVCSKFLKTRNLKKMILRKGGLLED